MALGWCALWWSLWDGFVDSDPAGCGGLAFVECVVGGGLEIAPPRGARPCAYLGLGWGVLAGRRCVRRQVSHVHLDSGCFLAGRSSVRCRVRTRPSGRRLFVRQQGLGSLDVGMWWMILHSDIVAGQPTLLD